jgi:hypothetical protein
MHTHRARDVIDREYWLLVFHQVIISSQSRYYRHSSLKRLLHYSELIDFSKKLSTAAESK